MANNTALSAYKAGQRSLKSNHKSRKSQLTIPVAAVAGFIPLGISLYNVHEDGFAAMSATLSKRLTGYDPLTAKWDWKEMKCGTLSIALGFFVHWLVGSKLGVNRMLSRTGIPLIRI